jgi:subtilase family serine protease
MSNSLAKTSVTGPTLVVTIVAVVFAVLALGFALASARAQTSAGAVQALITQPVVETNLVSVLGNVRPEANAANDRGLVPDTLPMGHMFLQLRRSSVQEKILVGLIDQLHNPNSPNFHHWLSASEFGTRFGPADSDIQKITGWLGSQGFSVNVVYPSHMTIDFSGTAGQVRAAFHTEIHNLQVNGAAHIANMSNPKIPTVLAPAVVGVVSLHDFPPQPAFSGSQDCNLFNVLTSKCYQVAPADLATIYNFKPVYSAGNTGQNQTIYLIEDNNLYSVNDWLTFRSLFGLLGTPPLNTIQPTSPSGTNCDVPLNYSEEVTLDAEWASAAAPGAAIVIASCRSGNGTDGLLVALTNLINQPDPPTIMSISYGQCETVNGATANAAFYAIYQQGVAEGASIFVAAGDQGAAHCDYSVQGSISPVTSGIGVNAYASTPYNVAVGGTDFGDTYFKANSTYWNSTNSVYFGSAKSYIPEIPWNATCGSQLTAAFMGVPNPPGSPNAFCNSAAGSQFEGSWSGGGGPSGCATGTPNINTPLVVSGTCAGYPKPSWQRGVFGIPNDGVRDLPDLSLFAAESPWGHSYVICYTAVSSCTNSAGQQEGGTSAATPIMAGVQALINQKMGEKQGNPNYQYYQLAAKEYSWDGRSICNSSLGNRVGSSCIFHDVTLGDTDRPCTGTNNCFIPSGTIGVLSTSNNRYEPTFRAGPGWDFATGIGTVNVDNLVTNWGARAFSDQNASYPAAVK